MIESSSGDSGPAAQVDERDVHVGGAVGAPAAGPPRREPERLPRAGFVMVGIKRRVRDRAGRRAASRPAPGRCENVSVVCLRRASGTTRYSCRFWSSRIGSEVCSNRLITGEQPSRKVSLARRPPPGSAGAPTRSNGEIQNQHLGRAAESGLGRSAPSRPRSKNRNFCGKREILLQQPVSGERSLRIRQQRLVLLEARPGAAPTPAATSGCFFEPGVRIAHQNLPGSYSPAARRASMRGCSPRSGRMRSDSSSQLVET